MYRIGRKNADAITIFVKVTPGAVEDAVGGVERQADGTLRLAVRVRAGADNGAANKAVIKLLARQFGLAKSGLKITRGATSRLKTVAAADSVSLRAQLEALV